MRNQHLVGRTQDYWVHNNTTQREEWHRYKKCYSDEGERDKDWRKELWKKKKDGSLFLFLYKKNFWVLLLFIWYLFFSSKVTHTRSTHKYTQSVMLTPRFHLIYLLVYTICLRVTWWSYFLNTLTMRYMMSVFFFKFHRLHCLSFNHISILFITTEKVRG